MKRATDNIHKDSHREHPKNHVHISPYCYFLWFGGRNSVTCDFNSSTISDLAPCQSLHSMSAPAKISGRASRFPRGLVVKALDCEAELPCHRGFETQPAQCINLLRNRLFVSHRRHNTNNNNDNSKNSNTCIFCACKTIPGQVKVMAWKQYSIHECFCSRSFRHYLSPDNSTLYTVVLISIYPCLHLLSNQLNAWLQWFGQRQDVSILEKMCHNSLWTSGAIWNWVNIGSGNGLSPDGTKPSPEPKMTPHQIYSMAFDLGQFHKK